MPIEPQPRYGEQFLHKQDSDLHRSAAVELEQIRRARALHDEEYLATRELRGGESEADTIEPNLQYTAPALQTEEFYEHSPYDSQQHAERHESPTAYVPHHGLDIEPHAKPTEKIEDWLMVLKHTHEGHRDDPRVLERIKDSYHKRYVIKPEVIPEAVYQLEARIARNMGYGDIPITDEYRHEKAREIIVGQEESLDRWVDYLTSEDAVYPMWLKYWAFTSVTKMGKFEKKIDDEGYETARFARRREDTVAPFPPLNPRALALTLSAIEAKAAQVGIAKKDRQAPANVSDRLDDTAFGQLLATESFSKLYTQFLIELPAYSAEGLRQTDGRWVKYDQGSDAQPLVDSLEGHPLEWCTASIDTARSQLAGGDFYVYYSLDENGDATIPRVAIRMEDDHIAEVRGIAPDQDLDPYIADVVAEKMQDFPDGKGYVQRAADMKRLTEIDEKVQRGMQLHQDDLRFLYEINSKINGFGYGDDPRIYSIRSERVFVEDMEVIYATDDHAKITQELISDGFGYEVAFNLDEFTGIDHDKIAHDLIAADLGGAVASNIDKFTGIDDNQIAYELISAGYGLQVAFNLDKFTGIDHNEIAHELIDAGFIGAVASNLTQFTQLDIGIAHDLICEREGAVVIRNIDTFISVDHNKIANQLIDAGYGINVANYIYRFTHADHSQVARKLIVENYGLSVARNIRLFNNVDHSQIVRELIDAGYIGAVAENIIEFNGIDFTQLAHELIAAGKGDEVARILARFRVNDTQIAYELITVGHGMVVIDWMDRFPAADGPKIALKLIDAGYGGEVAQGLWKFNIVDIDDPVYIELRKRGYKV